MVACEGHATGATWTNANAFNAVGVDSSFHSVLTGFSYFIMWAQNGGAISPGQGTMSWIAAGI